VHIVCETCRAKCKSSVVLCKRLWKALCLDLLEEGGSSEVRRSPVLCGVDFEALCM
jgi:hypothetical protein